jgi:hypothetical protein
MTVQSMATSSPATMPTASQSQASGGLARIVPAKRALVGQRVALEG